MRKLNNKGLSKQEITNYRRYERWYLRKEDTKEVLMMIDETKKNKENEIVNLVNYIDSFALLCVDNIDYCNRFFDKHKEYTPRLFIKNHSGSAYNEYAIESWQISAEGIYVKLA